MKKKVKISKKRVPKYDEGGNTPQLDPVTGLPIQSQIPFGMIGNFGGAAVDAFGQDDAQSKGYIGTKAASGALRMAGNGASVGMTVGGPLGAAVGAGAGAILGGAMGIAQGSRDRKDAKAEETASNFAGQQEIYQNRPDFFAFGGMINPNTIEVEKNELEVDSKNGKVLKKFDGQPSHANGGYQYNAKGGRVIIRGKDAEKFKSSDQFGRMSMVKEHVLSQKNNETMTNEYKNGGKIKFKSADSYHNWLGYLKATGVAGKTPTSKAVYVRGKRIVPKFEGGGGTGEDINRKLAVLKSQAEENQYNNPILMDPNQVGNPYSFVDSPNDLDGPWNKSLLSSKNQIQLPVSPESAFYQEAPIAKKPKPWTDGSENDPTEIVPRESQPNDSAIESPMGESPVSFKPGSRYSRGVNLNRSSLESPSGPPPNWSAGANQAATWAPVAYNALMAFQKPVKEAPIYNPHETEALNTLRNRKIDMDPIRRDIYSQERVAATPLGESQGSYLSRRTQLSANTQKALTDANLKAQDINNGYARDYAGGLDTFGQQRVGANRIARNQDINVAINQAQYLPKALEEASFLTQGISQDNKYVPMYAENLKNKYLMSLMDGGADYKTAKSETEKKYPVNEGKSSYSWMRK